MRIDLRTLAIACASACLVFCSTSNPQPPIDTNASSSSGGGSGGGTPLGDDDDSGASVDAAIFVPTGGFSVTGLLYDSTGVTPLSGASICLLATPNGCVSTTSAGAFTINGLVPKLSGITATDTGYVNGVWALTPTASLGSWNGYLRTQERINALAGQVNATFASTTGAIHFIAYDATGNGLTGVTVTASTTGTVGYFDTSGATLGTASTGVAETTSDGGGMIFGLAAGTTVDVTFTAQGKTCVHHDSSGWDPKSPSATMSVPIVGGSLTFAGGTCT